MTHITTEAEEEPIIRIAQNMGVEDINLFSGEEISDPNIYTVFLNGSFILDICLVNYNCVHCIISSSFR